jgi:Fe2+ or Zn2+ uptake regulation protein
MNLEEYTSLTDWLAWHLKVAGISVTDARKSLYLLLYWKGPCSPEEILGDGRAALTRPSMYRNLQHFLDLGIAQRVGKGMYEITDRFKQHHHYMVCRACGHRAAFWNEALEKAIHRQDRRAKPGGFALEEHSLELVGVCALCATRGEEPRAPIGNKIRRQPGWRS